MNNSYITIIKEKRTVLSRKRVPLNQNECTADFRIGVPFEQNLHTRGGLNLKLVGGYVVSMPCFIEQQKIVACLSALDDVIEKKKATLAAWEELKKGLLQQMFV